MDELWERKAVIDLCRRLKKEVSCDFVGLAMQDEAGPDVRWLYAIGNLNDKYKRIIVRFGKGIAGKVISSGSPMMMTDFPNDIPGKMTDYPISLAEKLTATYAAPLFVNGIPKGVLLIGMRIKHIFSEREQEKVAEYAEALEQVIKDEID